MMTQKHAMLVSRGTRRPVVKGYEGEHFERLNSEVVEDINYNLSTVDAMNLLGEHGYVFRKEEPYMNGQIAENIIWLVATTDDTVQNPTT